MGRGSSTRRGGGRKVSCPPSKVCLPWVSKRGIWDVPGILPGCPGPLGVFKKFVQQKFVRIFRSLKVAFDTVRLGFPENCFFVRGLVVFFGVDQGAACGELVYPFSFLSSVCQPGTAGGIPSFPSNIDFFTSLTSQRQLDFLSLVKLVSQSWYCT